MTKDQYKTISTIERRAKRHVNKALALGKRALGMAMWSQKMALLRIIHIEIDEQIKQRIQAESFLDSIVPQSR